MQIELRNDSVVVKGYVNAICRDSRVIKTREKEFVEQVRQGVWDTAIRSNNNVKLLLNHDWNKELGSTKENLELREDNIGLYATANISDKSIIDKARNKELVGWSFRFICNEQSFGKTDNDIERRYLDNIDLLEVSILDNTKTPAYYGTSIEARADGNETLTEQRYAQEDIEIVDLTTTEDTEQRNIDETETKLRLLTLELEI